jgi:hypothetical protein
MISLSAFYTTLSNEGINDLYAIQYIFFTIIVLFNNNFQMNKLNEIFIEKIKYLYTKFNINISFNINEITIKLFNLIISIDINKINKHNILNDIFEYYLKTDNLSISKNYIKYYNKKILSEWILNIGKPNILESMDNIFIGNPKINSYFDILIEQYKDIKNLNKLYGHQTNLIIKSLQLANIELNSDKNLNLNFTSSDLLIKDIDLATQTFDLIYFDFPIGIHNIIHANCCNKIKKLKLRGTKSEPLLLQLLMCSLNKNGRAVLVVPDSLLFSDSIQPIETRKYLIENFNVKKIIQIDESLYEGKGNKNSVLYFENNGVTKLVEFSKIYLDTNTKEIQETKQIDISIDKLKSNIYSLYYKNYESIRNSNEDIKFIKFNEVFEFKTNADDLSNYEFICLEKHYKNDKSIEKGIKNPDHWEHYIIEKNNNSNNFNIKLLENILKNKYQNLVKGKMNQFDLFKISQIEIPIISDTIKQLVFNYINITNKLILDNNEKITNTYKLKSYLMSSINLDKMILLEKIAELYNKKLVSDTKLNINMIEITRNGLSSGQVKIINSNDNILNNSHYIKIINNNYQLEFIYHWLKYNTSKLKELANLNPQPNLSQTNLLNFKIPDILIENQNELISYCNDFDSIIYQYELNNKLLIEKDIIGTIIKLSNSLNQ